jgi:predicted small secreted protein
MIIFIKKIKLAKKLNRFLNIVMFSFILQGCNTIEGAGADIKEAGKALERSAEEAQSKDPQSAPPSSPKM